MTCVVLPAAAVEGPGRRTALLIALTTLAFVLAGGGGALLLGRRLSRAIVQAAEGAVALAHGKVPDVPTSSVREVTELRGALLRSAALLAAREAERDENLRQARAAGQVKDEFLAMLGHELRTPWRRSAPRWSSSSAGGGQPRFGGHRAPHAPPDAPRGRPPRRVARDPRDADDPGAARPAGRGHDRGHGAGRAPHSRSAGTPSTSSSRRRTSRSWATWRGSPRW